MIDKIDFRKLSLFDLRSSLAIIPQDPTLFTGTKKGEEGELKKRRRRKRRRTRRRRKNKGDVNTIT